MKVSRISKLSAAYSIGFALFAAAASADDDTRIYTMDNAASANHVLVFRQDRGGGLHAEGSVETGGAGAGAGLSSQGSIALSQDGRWLFVCNAGSGEISVFKAGKDRLDLADKVNSGGAMPVSLALRDNLLYVLNAGGEAGGTDNLSGFVFADGKLHALPNSTQALSGTNTTPTDVAFSDEGGVLVVTEKGTSLIDTFAIGHDGLAASHQIFVSAGQAPFGFAAGRKDRIYVSEAAGVPGASSASSYQVSNTGGLTVISPTNSTMQQAACWLILSPDERFAYTANAGSGTLSGFGIASNGDLALLSANGVTANIGSGSHPVDMGVSHDGGYLFVVANGNGTLNVFHIARDGSLAPVDSVSGIAASAAGLAVRD
jgi:6-phosphogluconolactonase